jgi:hypothetical protein
VCATSSAPKNEFVSAEGAVVAIQGGKTDTRLVDPASFADLAEIYVVRVDRWSQPRKEKYILVEYIHHADLIRYDEFDKTRWNFEIHQASPEETRDCLSWMAREGSFYPTAFGAKAKLPDPKGLTCFLMEKRPLVVSESVPKLPAPDRVGLPDVFRVSTPAWQWTKTVSRVLNPRWSNGKFAKI